MKTYLALGTNLGNREENMQKALLLLGKEVGKLIRVSSFIETEPWGFVSQHAFLNGVVEVDTALSAEQLLQKANEIERIIGRLKKSVDGVYSDRLIDIDILLYGDEQIDTERLKVPHPLMLQRLFVMQPLAEIAPDLVHPVEGKTIRELADICKKG